MFLSSSYEAERKKLTEEVQNCEQGIQEYNENTKSADRFIKLIDKYSHFDELTNTMLLELIDKILVHERDVKGSSNCTQRLRSISILSVDICHLNISKSLRQRNWPSLKQNARPKQNGMRHIFAGNKADGEKSTRQRSRQRRRPRSKP